MGLVFLVFHSRNLRDTKIDGVGNRGLSMTHRVSEITNRKQHIFNRGFGRVSGNFIKG